MKKLLLGVALAASMLAAAPAANAAQLREALALYIGSGRRAAGSRRGRPAAAAGTKKASATDVRAWAAANGHQVSARGRVPAAVREAYEAAHA